MSLPRDLSSPSDNFFAVTPTDTAPASPQVFRSLRVGAAGDVKVVPYGKTAAEAVIFKDCAVGEVLPVISAWVLDTGTTASSLVGFE